MRFGRKNRFRPFKGAAVVSGSAAPALTTVDTEERNALLDGHTAGMAIFSEVSDAVIDPHDPPQQLLSALRQLNDAVTTTNGMWADECMNHLITGVEVALNEGWSPLVEALTDAGRILQTYDNASRASECAPFLAEAYETLCQMMGDMIISEDQIDALPRWRALYEKAVREVESSGLVLARDDDASGVAEEDATMEVHDSGAAEEVPFEMPTLNENEQDAWEYEEDLPVLEELPPLESMLTLETQSEPVAETGEASKSSDAEDMDLFSSVENATFMEEDSANETKAESIELPNEAGETTDDEIAAPKAEHSPLVVEILDRLCDQLAAMEKEDGETRSLAMERFEDGLSALDREAESAEHTHARELCELMSRTFSAGTLNPNAIESGVVDMAYSFCGVYMDAMEESEAESVGAWQLECEEFLRTLENAVAVDDEVQEQTVETNNEVMEHPEADAEGAVDEEVDSPVAAEEPAEANADAPRVDLVDAVMAAGDADSTFESEDVEVPDLEAFSEPEEEETSPPSAEVTSTQLLESAQRAAAQGDANAAKLFALQAAANIAGTEAEKAGARLHEAEERLRENLESSESARTAVKAAEDSVTQCAESVATGEEAVSNARDAIAQADQKLEDLKSGVSKLEEEIRALQKRRDEALGMIATAEETRSEAQTIGKDTDGQLDTLNGEEAAARTHLERCRQQVNDLQRNTSEIESEMEAARAFLATQKSTQADMDQMLETLRGNDDTGPSGSMLF